MRFMQIYLLLEFRSRITYYVKVPITIINLGIYLLMLISLAFIEFGIREKTDTQTNLLFVYSVY